MISDQLFSVVDLFEGFVAFFSFRVYLSFRLEFNRKIHKYDIMFDILSANFGPVSFWNSINILLSKPHVINKRLWGCKTWIKLTCRPSKPDTWEPPSQFNKLKHNLTNENAKNFSEIILEKAELKLCNSDENDSLVHVILLELFPKNFSESQVCQLIFMDKDKCSVSFYDITQGQQNLFPEDPYTLQWEDKKVILKAYDEKSSKSYLWLKNTLLPQIVKWGSETPNNLQDKNICKESLALVSQEKYYSKYNKLKLKYGKEMVKIWPECTDPSKFVYEDVAIATYLLLLWEDKNARKQTFVDLGCGNGLLVYILAKEGHSGVGIDVRKRNIWDIYSSDVKLEERTIIPSDSSLFPETDWIIGNHSDELTPWIPVIAAKSSYKCNFFLLPCCAYNFDGTKYQRRDSSKSQYNDYLEYVKVLSEECGFNTNVDRLKIPSTKRICIIGKGRTYIESEYEKHCNNIQNIIERSSCSGIENDSSWVKDFKPREAVERVRNCTQIDKNLITSIVKSISGFLLEGCEGTSWKAGKTVELSELIQLIPEDQLKQLKSECGGIQTLLKNNHNIFRVQSGKVQLRYPKTVEEVNKSKAGNLKVQQRPCWFYNNHPQGCPLSDTSCSFLHVKSL